MGCARQGGRRERRVHEGLRQRTLGAPKAQPAASAPDEPADLARSKGCFACHAVDRRVVGTAFKEAAKKYKSEPGIEAKLVKKLHVGGSGAWGSIPRPPNPDLGDSDARALVRWVLGL